ncbi:MAG: 1-acyl-sn-glycerol-3-phosphate acyltransferase [Chloroflexi bacterium]|nr:1-acyl-sn-glycerol-3-phosphate acyltransferase [Chloroflexota bacterium]
MTERPIVMVIITVFDWIFRLLSNTRYVGRENIPQRGPFLIVVNHMSYTDAPLVAVGVRHPGMVALAADNYRANPLFRWLVETVGGVWINRGSSDRGAIKAAVEVLGKGMILGISPEGTRSRVTHAMMQGKTGAAFIASKVGVPVLPIGIAGTDKVFSDLKRLRRPKIVFNIGPTFVLPPLEGPNKSKLLEESTHEIMCRIGALLPERYHGVYTADPRIEEIRKGVARWEECR